MKDNQHVKPIIDVENQRIVFKIRGHDDRILDMTKVHPAIKERAAYAGLAQVRLVDMAAIGMTDDEGNIIPEVDRIAMKAAAIGRGIDHYHTGTADWNLAGTGGGGGKSVTIEAIARVKGTDYETAKASVEAYAAKKGIETKKALAHLRTGKAVSAAILAIREERMPKASVDADAALAELGDE